MKQTEDPVSEAMPRRPSTAREALIVEALGDLARLMDRLEALAPSLNQARRGLSKANADLADRTVAFEGRMAAISENAKAVVVDHILRRTQEIARRSALDQMRTMQDAVRALFKTEFGPTLSTLDTLLGSLRQLIERMDRPWDPWLMHAATATVSSAATAVGLWLCLHK